jgi:kinesin family protein 4/21/27
MNVSSSRSHAIFSITLNQAKLVEEEGDSSKGQWEKYTSKFHFVDLAGSERVSFVMLIQKRY